MKVCIAHNEYRFPGGEDAVRDAEAELLRRNGHVVTEFVVKNSSIRRPGPGVALNAIWSRRSVTDLRQLLSAFEPDICHVHNTLPLLSPATFHACGEFRIPVVHTVHNYRLVCPAATLFRNGAICENCLGRRFAWPSVMHGCYRGSRAGSCVAAATNALHHVVGTWAHKVDLYIAPSEVVRLKLIRGGYPAERIHTKPHFLPDDPGLGGHSGEYALYVGRLAPEKGIDTMLAAWSERLPIPLKIVGTGPLANERVGREHGVEWLGHVDRSNVYRLMQDAAFLVFPSRWQETFGMTLIEAFATGLPVIASRVGAPAAIVRHKYSGLHFEPSNPHDLARTVRWAVENRAAMERLGANARAEYELRYTAQVNLPLMLDLYDRARANARRSG